MTDVEIERYVKAANDAWEIVRHLQLDTVYKVEAFAVLMSYFLAVP